MIAKPRITLLLSLLVVVSSLIVYSCESEKDTPGVLEDVLKGSMNVRVNPSGRVPLGGLLTFRTEEPCKVRIEVPGKVSVVKEFSEYNKQHSIPVLGLYAGKLNEVKVNLEDESGRAYYGIVELETDSLPDFFPSIEVMTLKRDQMEDGFHLVDMLIANNGKFHTYSIMFDDLGDIRWYLDMSEVGQISYSPGRLKNGNRLYLSWIDLWELDLLGREVSKEQMWNYAGNHAIIELENDRLLMGGSKKDASVMRNGQEILTRYDFVLVWDRKENKGIKDWDLGEVLDVDRSVYPADYGLDPMADWFHLNSIAVDRSDNTIIASGRNQGVLKVDGDNNLKWIFAPHRSWGQSGRNGNGFETSEYLLTAVDSIGNPYPKNVQSGYVDANEFEWSTGQHSINVLENGNILLFDNGMSRNFDSTPSYSRIVEYKIDEENNTVQQVWQYGKERGLEMFSPITSNVEIMHETGNRLITAGTIRKGQQEPHSKMIEITYPDKNVVFESLLFFKDAKGTGEATWAQFDLVFRGSRESLYP